MIDIITALTALTIIAIALRLEHWRNHK